MAAMMYAACTVRLPGALLVSTPLLNVADELWRSSIRAEVNPVSYDRLDGRWPVESPPCPS